MDQADVGYDNETCSLRRSRSRAVNMRHRYRLISFFSCFCIFSNISRPEVEAFVPSLASSMTARRTGPLNHPILASLVGDGKSSTPSWVLPPEDVHAIIKFKSGDKEKVINLFGVWTILVSLIVSPTWMIAMKSMNVIYNFAPEFDSTRSIYDATGKIWSKAFLALCNSYPEITGDLDRIRDKNGGACLYVANHASWLDIPVLCTVLDPVFKFIAKGELAKVPCIGDQLVGGNHIMIDRDDRRSQLRTFKEGISHLKSGIPIMAFPEGQRSKDGRLMDFKSGLFLMALKTNVPIVPITVCNTHAVMPSNAFLPVQTGAGKLKVHVHKQVETEGKTEAEIISLVRDAIISELPEDQTPFLESKSKEMDGAGSEKKL